MLKRKILAKQNKLNLLAKIFFNHGAQNKNKGLSLLQRMLLKKELFWLHSQYKRQALTLLNIYMGQKKHWYSLVNFDSYSRAYDNILKKSNYLKIIQGINKVPYLYDIFEPMLEISRIMSEIRKENKFFDIQKDLVQNIYLPNIKRIIKAGLAFKIPG